MDIGHWRKFDTFLAVVRRMLRDGPMPASEFGTIVRQAGRRYGIQERSFEANGVFNFYIRASWLIGDARLINGEIVVNANHLVAEKRDREFSRPKYKKMSRDHVGFLKSLFELSEYTSQLSKEQRA